jgi:hypothetical protein
MKPLILGMGPSRLYPVDAWHPEALSTINLCRLILGAATSLPAVKHHFEVIDLNKRWFWIEGKGDCIEPNEAEETLKLLIKNGELRSGRKAFLLGEQVTDFVFASLRRTECIFSKNAWRNLQKCEGVRLCTDDREARIGAAAGFYDFVAIPVWHPRILMDQAVQMPPGWQQRMMNAMRSAAKLSPFKFSRFAMGRTRRE